MDGFIFLVNMGCVDNYRLGKLVGPSPGMDVAANYELRLSLKDPVG